VIFKKLHTAGGAVVGQQIKRRQEIQPKPRGGEFLDETRLILLHQGEDDDCAYRRHPGRKRENVVIHFEFSLVI
jgi:hypothetical protein